MHVGSLWLVLDSGAWIENDRIILYLALDLVTANLMLAFYRNPEKRIYRRFHRTAAAYKAGAIWGNVMRHTIQEN